MISSKLKTCCVRPCKKDIQEKTGIQDILRTHKTTLKKQSSFFKKLAKEVNRYFIEEIIEIINNCVKDVQYNQILENSLLKL